MAEKPSAAPVEQKKARLPKQGDVIRFVSHVRAQAPHYAIVARVYGTSVVNLGYLSESGVWFSSTSVRYSAEKAEGSWHWPESE